MKISSLGGSRRQRDQAVISVYVIPSGTVGYVYALSASALKTLKEKFCFFFFCNNLDLMPGFIYVFS